MWLGKHAWCMEGVVFYVAIMINPSLVFTYLFSIISFNSGTEDNKGRNGWDSQDLLF